MRRNSTTKMPCPTCKMEAAVNGTAEVTSYVSEAALLPVLPANTLEKLQRLQQGKSARQDRRFKCRKSDCDYCRKLEPDVDTFACRKCGD